MNNLDPAEPTKTGTDRDGRALTENIREGFTASGSGSADRP